jgi:hypothetical protein
MIQDFSISGLVDLLPGAIMSCALIVPGSDIASGRAPASGLQAPRPPSLLKLWNRSGLGTRWWSDILGGHWSQWRLVSVISKSLRQVAASRFATQTACRRATCAGRSCAKDLAAVARQPLPRESRSERIIGHLNELRAREAIAASAR